MSNHHRFLINGRWVEPSSSARLDVINPATEEIFASIALGSAEDADAAVLAARRAFESFSTTSRAARVALLQRILAGVEARAEELAGAISDEMGAPLDFALEAQVGGARLHLETTIGALERFEFEQMRGSSLILREGIGVCALITPWNWPLYQVVCKVAPALAAGCTMVLKPSELAPISSLLFAEILVAAGTPPGVFNLVNGTGPQVGAALAAHPSVDMVSFTGSTRAGIDVAKTGAETVKRIAQELGGKSANIILADADLEEAVEKGVDGCFSNSGQSCDAPTRMLVPAHVHERALEVARAAASRYVTGDPRGEGVDFGPVISRAQFDKIQALIATAIAEGAHLVCGGGGRPEGLAKGYYVRPTIFAGVTPAMTIASEEVFGPVLAIMPYRDEEEAIAIANDSIYGLAAYVQSRDLAHAREVARRMKAGSVYINYPEFDPWAPFGGYKQSGNGREFADWGLHDFLEVKGMIGWQPPVGG